MIPESKLKPKCFEDCRVDPPHLWLCGTSLPKWLMYLRLWLKKCRLSMDRTVPADALAAIGYATMIYEAFIDVVDLIGR